MDVHHRKIDLQSPEDLTYLYSNISNAAQQKLDLAIPPVETAERGANEDAFRNEVEKLVHEYITKTLHLALPSLAINGLDASPNILSRPIISSENFEPYDPRLASKIRNLYVNLEAETTRVAQLRREAPAVAAKAYTERLEREIGEDHAGLEDGMIKIGNAQREGLLGGNHGEIERAGDVRRAWQEALEGLVQFRDVTEQVAKLDRAKDVVAVVQGR